MGLCLGAVTPHNVAAACRLAVRPDQERHVWPVAVSLAEAYARPTIAWPRLILRDGELVGICHHLFHRTTWSGPNESQMRKGMPLM